MLFFFVSSMKVKTSSFAEVYAEKEWKEFIECKIHQRKSLSAGVSLAAVPASAAPTAVYESQNL